MTLPNFLLVGAPKCGTTALYTYLREHPDVFMSDPKEPHFFGADLEFRYRRRPDLETYRGLFGGARQARIGEASVWYLYSERAAAEIKAMLPEARILVMLRDPAEMIPSLHAQMVYNGHENLDLASALEAEPERARGSRIPAESNFPAGLLYRRVASYADQLERYLDSFGRASVHVILYDDFRVDPAGSHARVLRFLGLPPAPADYAVVNANKVSRSRILRRALNRPPEWLRRPIRAVVPAATRRRFYRAVVQLNTQSAGRTPVSPDVIEAIRRDLAPDVRRLADILGRGLDAWLPRAEGA